MILLATLALLAATVAGQSTGRAGAPTASPKVDEKELAAFFESVAAGDAAAVRRFLAGGMSANARAPQPDDEPALLRAVGSGHAEVVEALLQAGADVSLMSEGDGSSALNQAVTLGSPRIVRLLLAHKADVNYGDDTGHSNLMTAAMMASIFTLPAEARLFLEPEGKSPEVERLGKVPRQDRLEIVRLLIEAKADVNLTADDCGLSALMSAAMLGDAEVARLLLEAGADPNVGTKQFHPLRFAVMTLEEFLRQARGEDRDAEPDEQTRQAAATFIEATAKGRAEIARLLRAAGAREPGDWPEENAEKP
jgi:ankyrin repeat protein